MPRYTITHLPTGQQVSVSADEEPQDEASVRKLFHSAPPPPTPTLSDLMQRFTQQDMLRRTGQAAGPAAAVNDRFNEGALMAKLLGPAAPLATLPVAAAGAAYEGVKGLGQATGIGKYFPGPFKTDASTSPPSIENLIGLLRGYSTGGRGL